VSFEEGEALAREFKIPFFETSAINDINVDEAFMKITKDVCTKSQVGNTAGLGGLKGSAGTTSTSRPVAVKSISSADTAPARRSWCVLL
jgi:hypothetical protein